MRVLIVSNGYGEDAMGAVLGRALRKHGAEVLAYPLVGLGHAYQGEGIPVLDPVAPCPPQASGSGQAGGRRGRISGPDGSPSPWCNAAPSKGSAGRVTRSWP
jgi:hypothetical protein